jgi:hypothetical protein
MSGEQRAAVQHFEVFDKNGGSGWRKDYLLLKARGAFPPLANGMTMTTMCLRMALSSAASSKSTPRQQPIGSRTGLGGATVLAAISNRIS